MQARDSRFRRVEAPDQIDRTYVVGKPLVAGRHQESPFEQAPARIQFGVQRVGLLFPDQMKLVRQLERASKFEAVELALDAFDSREVVKTGDDVVERLRLYGADCGADVIPQLETRDNSFHGGPSSRRCLLGQGIGHVQAGTVELEKLAREDIPWNSVISLRTEGEQRLAQGDLVGRLVQAVQDQGLPVIAWRKVVV